MLKAQSLCLFYLHFNGLPDLIFLTLRNHAHNFRQILHNLISYSLLYICPIHKHAVSLPSKKAKIQFHILHTVTSLLDWKYASAIILLRNLQFYTISSDKIVSTRRFGKNGIIFPPFILSAIHWVNTLV